MRRYLLGLVALALVPLIVFTTPNVAQAATAYGAKASGNFELNGNLGGDWLNCNFQAWWVVPETPTVQFPTHVNVPSFKCSAGWWVKASTVSLTMTMSGDSGTCSASSSTGGSAFSDGSTVTLPGASFGVVDTCNVDTFCVSGTAESNNFPDPGLGEQVCIPLAVGLAPTPSGGECPEGRVVGATESAPIGGDTKYRDTTIRFQDAADGSSWIVVRIMRGQNGNPNPVLYGTEVVTVSGGVASTGIGNIPIANWPESLTPSNLGHIVGVMVFRNATPYYGYGLNDARNLNAQTNPETFRRFVAAGPVDGFASYLATQDVSACRYYFGEKFNDIAGDSDEPNGDIGTDGTNEPDVEGPGGEPEDDTPDPIPAGGDCSFSISDPSSWLEGGMCAAVGLLGRIVQLLGNLLTAVADLASDIVAGILDGLVAAFELLLDPHPNTWGFDGLMQQADERPPFSLVGDAVDTAGAMHEEFSSAGASCGAMPGFPIVPGGSETRICDGGTFKTGYGAWLYSVVSFGLICLTGFYMARMIASRAARGAE